MMKIKVLLLLFMTFQFLSLTSRTRYPWDKTLIVEMSLPFIVSVYFKHELNPVNLEILPFFWIVSLP